MVGNNQKSAMVKFYLQINKKLPRFVVFHNLIM